MGPGSIEQAHSPVEWVELEQVEKCAALYEDIVRSGSPHRENRLRQPDGSGRGWSHADGWNSGR